MKKIKLLVLDVDGTLTDGKIYISPEGESMKAFHVRDGYGIANILPKIEIEPIIITGRKSNIVEQRCKELKINECYQGISNKEETLCTILEQKDISWEQVAYMGDDLPDYACMQKCGIKACPSDAVAEIKKICDFVIEEKGGEGAVRAFIEKLAEMFHDDEV